MLFLMIHHMNGKSIVKTMKCAYEDFGVMCKGRDRGSVRSHRLTLVHFKDVVFSVISFPIATMRMS
jgi:hypothetical protein